VRTVRDSRPPLLDGILPKSSCFPQNPSFFHHPTPTSYTPFLRARAVLLAFPIRTPKPYFFHSNHPPSQHSWAPTSALRFCYCLFNFTWARDYLGPSVICFYRHVRTNERFNFTQVTKKEQEKNKIVTKWFFFFNDISLYLPTTNGNRLEVVFLCQLARWQPHAPYFRSCMYNLYMSPPLLLLSDLAQVCTYIHEFALLNRIYSVYKNCSKVCWYNLYG